MMELVSCEEISVENNPEKINRLESFALFVGLTAAVIIICFYGHTLFELDSITTVTDLVPNEIDDKTPYISIAEYLHYKLMLPDLPVTEPDVTEPNIIQGFENEVAVQNLETTVQTTNIISVDMIAEIGGNIYEQTMMGLPEMSETIITHELKMKIKDIVLETIEIWGPTEDDLVGNELPPFDLLKSYFHVGLDRMNETGNMNTQKTIIELIGTIVTIEGNCFLAKTKSAYAYNDEIFDEYLKQFRNDHTTYTNH